MIGPALLAVLAQGGLQAAIEHVRAGDFRGALAAAEAEADPARRAEAVLYVRHQAGDLDGALRVGLAGAASVPRDTWLLERTAFVALSLRRTEPARTSLKLWRDALATDPTASRESLAALQSYETENAGIVSRLARRDTALSASRWIAGASVGLALAALVLLALAGGTWSPGRKAP